MRLSAKKILEIKDTGEKIFGNNISIYLFGSRVDDTTRGGDIDLLIKLSSPKGIKNRLQLKLKFLVELKKRIGEQKIDLLLDIGQKTDAVFDTAYKTGIQL
jgi:predicted nucleotidyltransferase